MISSVLSAATFAKRRRPLRFGGFLSGGISYADGVRFFFDILICSRTRVRGCVARNKEGHALCARFLM